MQNKIKQLFAGILFLLLTISASVVNAQGKTSGEEFVEFDPTGAGMAIIAMSVVFSALILLFVAFTIIFRLMNKPKKTVETAAPVKKEAISGEVNAAIALALYLYQDEMHDLENTVLTVKKVARTYSPWSSKIYTLRKSPR